MGDFDFPEIDWSKGISKTREGHEAAKYLKTTRDAYLIQHQLMPTRQRGGQRAILDDLFFTDRDDIVNDIEETVWYRRNSSIRDDVFFTDRDIIVNDIEETAALGMTFFSLTGTT